MTANRAPDPILKTYAVTNMGRSTAIFCVVVLRSGLGLSYWIYASIPALIIITKEVVRVAHCRLDHSRYWSIKWYSGRGRFDTPGKYFAAHRPQGQPPLQVVLPL